MRGGTNNILSEGELDNRETQVSRIKKIVLKDNKIIFIYLQLWIDFLYLDK